MVLRAVITGAALSAVTVGVIGSLQPDTPLHLPASPWGDYKALATATDVSLPVVFAWTWLLVAVCLFAALRKRERQRARIREMAAALEMEDLSNDEEMTPCSPS